MAYATPLPKALYAVKRACPKCGEDAVRVSSLTFSGRTHCEKCFYEFTYSMLSNALMQIVGWFIPTLAIVLGLMLKSWIVFGAVLVLLPVFGIYLLSLYRKLKPVGFRAELSG